VVRVDALGRIAPHTETISLLGVKVQTHVKREVGQAFDKMAATVDKGNAAGVRAVIGIPRVTVATQPLVDTFRDKNIALMQKAGADYVDKVREILENPENEGLRVEELADQFRAAAEAMGEKGDAFASRAELIARDQTLKLNAQLTETRMTANGITRYTWSTSGDERVRPTHEEQEGKEFSWDDPPAVGSNGERCNPGEDIQCRCVPLPVLPDFDAL
jgi:SPP1 gp7 family putative phage head morphogenesis protein